MKRSTTSGSAVEKRKQRRLAKLGSPNPICVLCGDPRWQCIEKHHLAGKKHSEHLVNLCSNCHAVQSDMQRDQPACTTQPSRLESIGYQQIGLADFLVELEKRTRENAHYLISLAQENDDESTE